MAKVLIFGTGSIGSVYACILSRGGTDVTCVCRSNYAAVQKNGIRVVSPILGDMHAHPRVINAVDNASNLLPKVSEDTANQTHSNKGMSVQHYDFVVVCTKATEGSIRTTIKALQEVIMNDRTTLVVIQNGLGVEKPFQLTFPHNTILSGVAYLPTTHLGAACYSHNEMERLYLGLVSSGASSSDVSSSRLRDFALLITSGKGTVVISQDIQAERWIKIIANGAINPICALSRCRDRELIEAEPSLGAEVIHDVMVEVMNVARAAGYQHVIDSDVVKRQMSRVWDRPKPGVQPSMMADALNSRPMEVEAVIGEIVRAASTYDVAIPRLTLLYVLVKGLAFSQERTAVSE